MCAAGGKKHRFFAKNMKVAEKAYLFLNCAALFLIDEAARIGAM
jgi:hypothetical protein